MSVFISGPRLFPGVVAVIAALSLTAIPVVAVLGTADRPVPVDDVVTEDVEKLTIPEERERTVEEIRSTTASQVSFLRLSDGHRTGTASERFARPALSLIKLYIAAHVIEHGTFTEKYEAIAMISSSDDRTAELLHHAYPEAIETVAEEYGLTSTRSHERWGQSVTSTWDAVNFIAQLIEEDPTHPILVAMAEATPVAADGYGQDFGTSVLPGVIGTKWGWSNALDLHSSVSFGENFVVAAALTGTADDLSDLVEEQLLDEVAAAEEA